MRQLLGLMLLPFLLGCRGQVTEKQPIFKLNAEDAAYIGPVGRSFAAADTNGAPVQIKVAGERMIRYNHNSSKFNSEVESYYEHASGEAGVYADGLAITVTLVQQGRREGPINSLSVSFQDDADTTRGREFDYSVNWNGPNLATYKTQIRLVPGSPMVDCIVFDSTDLFKNNYGDETQLVKEIVFAKNIGLVRARFGAKGWVRDVYTTRQFSVARKLQ